MDFDLTEEQRLLKDSVDRLIGDRYGFEQRKAYGRARRLEPRAVGAIRRARPARRCRSPRSDGGFGGGPVETMIVDGGVRPRAGARAVSGDGRARRRLAAPRRQRRAARRRSSRRIADGSLTLAFAHTERQSRYDLADVATTARARRRRLGARRRQGRRAARRQRRPADRHRARSAAAGATATGSACSWSMPRPRASSRRGYPTQDGLRAAEVTLAGVRVGPKAVLGEPGAALPLIERVVDEAIAALCAEAVGAMAAMHELTVDYLKTRKQFGVRDRQLPGAAAPRRRHAGGAGAGAQHGDVRDDDGGRGRTPPSAASAIVGGQGADRPLRPLRRPAGDPAAWRHRHDHGVQGRPLLQAR